MPHATPSASTTFVARLSRLRPSLANKLLRFRQLRRARTLLVLALVLTGAALLLLFNLNRSLPQRVAAQNPNWGINGR